MSRGRSGVIKALKEVFREIKFFGDAELGILKKELENHKLQLEQLKAQRQEQARREEELALLEMRKAVAKLQLMVAKMNQQEEVVAQVTEELGKKARAIMDQKSEEREARVMGALGDLNIPDLLTQTEGELEQSLQRLKADLAAGAAAADQPLPAAPVAAAAAARPRDD